MYVYIIGNKKRLRTFQKKIEIRYIKIGISKDPAKRLKELQTGCPFYLEIIEVFQTEDARYLESKLHKDLERYQSCGEWFEIPVTGLNKTLEYIKSVIKGEIPDTPILNRKERFRNKVKKAIQEGWLTKENFEEWLKLRSTRKIDFTTKLGIVYEELTIF